MLKTNSKAFLLKVDHYITSRFVVWYDDNESFLPAAKRNQINTALDSNDMKMISNIILESFYIQAIKNTPAAKRAAVDHRYSVDVYRCFKNWASGLPFILNCDYYYKVSAIDLLGDMLEETDEERNKFSESQAEEMLTLVLYKRLLHHDNQLINIMKGGFKNV